MKRIWPLRLVRERDIPELKSLIEISVRCLQAPYYSPAQMEAALGPVFGVDQQLIRDGTYFAVEDAGRIAGCGGWSKRRTLFGPDLDRSNGAELLDSKSDSARVRAFSYIRILRGRESERIFWRLLRRRFKTRVFRRRCWSRRWQANRSMQSSDILS